MRTANTCLKALTMKILSLLMTLLLTTTVFTACSDANMPTAADLPESTSALIISDCTNEDGVYYVLAYAQDADGVQTKELYKLPLSSRFVAEFEDPASEDGHPLFFAGPSKFHESGLVGGKLTVKANSFIINDSGELILLTDALPEAE